MLFSSAKRRLVVAALCALTSSASAVEPRAIFYRGGYADTEADARIARHDMVVDSLAGHLEWLRAHGYEPITLASLIARTAPTRGVLLGFACATQAFVERILPVLRAFEWPAVLAVPVSDADDCTPNGDAETRALTASELRALADHDGIELAATGGTLMRPIVANAGGDLRAATTTREYDRATSRYESIAAQAARVEVAVRNARVAWTRKLGRAPDAWWWPLDAWNVPALEASRTAGFRTTLASVVATMVVAQPMSIAEMPILGPTLAIDTPLATFIDTMRGQARPVDHRILEVAVAPTAENVDIEAARIAKSASAFGVDVVVVHLVDAAPMPDRTIALLDHLVSRLRQNPKLHVYVRSDLDLAGAEVLGAYTEWVGRVYADGYVLGRRQADATMLKALRRTVAELRPGAELRLVGSDDFASTEGTEGTGGFLIEGTRAAALLARIPPTARSQVWAMLTPTAGADPDGVMRDLRTLRYAQVRHIGIRWDGPHEATQTTYTVLAQELSTSSYPYPHD